eukprot:3748307-Amphidinium_carterae.1
MEATAQTRRSFEVDPSQLNSIVSQTLSVKSELRVAWFVGLKLSITVHVVVKPPLERGVEKSHPLNAPYHQAWTVGIGGSLNRNLHF